MTWFLIIADLWCGIIIIVLEAIELGCIELASSELLGQLFQEGIDLLGAAGQESHQSWRERREVAGEEGVGVPLGALRPAGAANTVHVSEGSKSSPRDRVWKKGRRGKTQQRTGQRGWRESQPPKSPQVFSQNVTGVRVPVLSQQAQPTPTEQ